MLRLITHPHFIIIIIIIIIIIHHFNLPKQQATYNSLTPQIR